MVNFVLVILVVAASARTLDVTQLLILVEVLSSGLLALFGCVACSILQASTLY